MFNVYKVGCIIGGDAFLLMTEEKAALIDTGFSFTAKKMAQNVKNKLRGRKLDYIILTHSHYDHVSGAMVCKKIWKDAQIITAKHADEVFAKPSVIKRMKKLNRIAALSFKKLPIYGDTLKGLRADRIVKEGDIIDMGSMKLKVMESPGHTWDMIALWSEEERFLVANETVGVLVTNDVLSPACLVSYKKCIEFVERARALKPTKILVPHFDMIYGDLCDWYFELSMKWHGIFKDFIVSLHNEGKTKEEIMKAGKEKFWVAALREGQPEAAFDMNNKHIVDTVLKEYCE